MTPRIDAHHHFWDPSRAHYPWMTADLDEIRRPFGPRDLQPELEANGIDATVLVQTRSSLEETEEFIDTANRTPFVSGVVGWVDLTDPEVAQVIHRLRRMGPLIGIRHQVQDEEDERWLCRDDVRRGLRYVAESGLTYDLLVRTRELPSAVETVRALPQLSFVLDHAAKPDIAKRTFEPWAGHIQELARLDNVCCKLSGLVTEADLSRWTVEDLRPYVGHVIAAFGPERIMFGSDWPVCLLAASYTEVVEALWECLADLSDAERAMVFGGTAGSTYGIAAPPSAAQ